MSQDEHIHEVDRRVRQALAELFRTRDEELVHLLAKDSAWSAEDIADSLSRLVVTVYPEAPSADKPTASDSGMNET